VVGTPYVRGAGGAFDLSNLQAIAPTGGLPGESNWGLVSLWKIAPGIATGPNVIQQDLTKLPTYVWNPFDSVQAKITGMFYGGVDQSVTFNADGTVTILTTGIHVEMRAVDQSSITGTLDENPPNFNPLARTAANRYTGWLDGSGTLLLDASVNLYQRFDGTTLANGVFTGKTDIYVQVNNVAAGGTGVWNDLWGGGITGLPGYYTDPAGNNDDVFLEYTLTDPLATGWNTLSFDTGGVNITAIPEPLTMIGVFLGVGGLARYVRRRMA